MVDHEFGGGWTSLKLDLLDRYLTSWLQVMKKQSFELIYIDAFAGTGRFTPKGQAHSIDGSVLRALRHDEFDHFYFFEKDPAHFQYLEALCSEEQFIRKSPIAWNGDGNQLVQQALQLHDWKQTRAVLFLDPYGMEVEWSTLKAIAKTGAIDVWYLFSISGIFRNAAKNYESVDARKEAALTRALGTDDWKRAFYRESDQFEMFGQGHAVERDKDVNDLERYVRERLETLFPMVLEPRRLLGPKNVPLFSLFFAASNPSSKAQGIAKNIASYLINKI